MPEGGHLNKIIIIIVDEWNTSNFLCGQQRVGGYTCT